MGAFGTLGALGVTGPVVSLLLGGAGVAGVSFALLLTETSPESVFTVIWAPPLPVLPLMTEFP